MSLWLHFHTHKGTNCLYDSCLCECRWLKLWELTHVYGGLCQCPHCIICLIAYMCGRGCVLLVYYVCYILPFLESYFYFLFVFFSYISCNPESLVANAIELCTPSADKTEKGNKNNRGWRNMSSAGLARHRAKSMPNSEPFQPVKAMAVDLFPHTPHCEMVMLLER